MEGPGVRIPLLSQDVLDGIPNKKLDIPYACQSPNQLLDLYYPDQGEGPFPLVVHFHGGAFLFGTKRDANLRPMLRLLRHGYAAASVEYRLRKDQTAVWGPSAGGYPAAITGATNGNPTFEDCRMHPADLPWHEAMCTEAYRSRDIDLLCPRKAERLKRQLLAQGPRPALLAGEDRIDLGGRVLHILHTPGHTPGSICLWDDKSGALFAGDSLSAAAVWLYDAYSEPLDVYYQSLGKLQAMLSQVSVCCIGHPPGRMAPELMEDTLACARRILMCDEEGFPAKTFAGEGLLFAYGASSILYNPNRLFRCKK